MPTVVSQFAADTVDPLRCRSLRQVEKAHLPHPRLRPAEPCTLAVSHRYKVEVGTAEIQA